MRELVLDVQGCPIPDESKQDLDRSVQHLRRRIGRSLDMWINIEGIHRRPHKLAPLSWLSSQGHSTQIPVVPRMTLTLPIEPSEHLTLGMPFPCSQRGCVEFHENLHGFCHQHRHLRFTRKIWSSLTMAWNSLQLFMLLLTQASLEIQDRALLGALVLSLLPIALYFLKWFVGLPATFVCVTLSFGMFASLICTAVRFDKMQHALRQLLLKTEGRYLEILQTAEAEQSDLGVSTLLGARTEQGDLLRTKNLDIEQSERMSDARSNFQEAKRLLPFFQSKVCFPLSAVANSFVEAEIKSLSHLHCPAAVDVLYCNVLCDNLHQVQHAWHLLQGVSDIEIVASHDAFAQLSTQKCCRVVVSLEGYLATVFLMDASITAFEEGVKDLQLANTFGFLDQAKPQYWEVSMLEAPVLIPGWCVVLTWLLRYVGQIVSAVLAVYFFSATCWFLLPLESLESDETSLTSEEAATAAVFACPFLVLVMVFAWDLRLCVVLPCCCCCCRRPLRRRRPKPTQIFYRKYFGVQGNFYDVKVAALQLVTVLVQAKGKFAMIKFFGKESTKSPSFLCFFGLLCWNSIYPALVLAFPDSKFSRVGAAFMDAGLDLGYLATWIWLLTGPGYANFGVNIFSGGLLLMSSLASTGFFRYMSVYISVAHICCVCCSLEQINWNHPFHPSDQKKPRTRRHRRIRILCSVVYAVGLLVTVGVLRTQIEYEKCGFCKCPPAGHGDGETGTALHLETCKDAASLHMETLDLKGCNIESIAPDALKGLSHLTSLHLENNNLTMLPAEVFRDLTSLKYLYLDNNSLATLPTRIFQDLTSLEYLYLNSNSLATLPAGIFQGLTSLQLLSLDSNKLNTLLVEAFEGLTSLQYLYLGNNKLATLPAEVCRDLTSLQYLYLNSNSLATLPAGIFQVLTSLQYLYLNNNKLATLPAEVFRDLTSLQGLSLDNNKLNTLLFEAFEGLTSLQYLYLNSNKLATLHAEVFRDLTSLQYLDLNSNSLATLPAGIFQGLTSLQRLSLDSNKLNTLLVEAFEGLTSLQYLYLGNNKLATLPAEVCRDLTSLQYLYLNSNSLATLPAGIFQVLTSLQRLSLDNNKLNTLLVEAFEGLTSLQYLDLSNNKLATLPAGIFQVLTSLQRLSLDNNKLNTLLVEAFEGLTSLQYLDLSNNKLATLPAGIFQGLTSLQRLSLNNNKVTTLLVEAFEGLTSLQYLYLDNNKLTTLPAEVFRDLASLQYLDLNSNSLATLPAGIFQGLTSLQRLSLDSNKLNTLLVEAFEGLTSLQYLYLGNNKLATLHAEVFRDLTSLQYLYLHSNSLATLPAGIFQGLTSLQRLSLDNNKLNTLLVEAFEGLTSLQYLYLGNNKLATLPAEVFRDLTSLQYLYLDNNKLTTLHAGIFVGLTSLYRLNLSDNNLTAFPAEIFQGVSAYSDCRVLMDDASTDC